MKQEERPTNRLAGETSPYLLQHRYNPVDWYPWGDEAFARARAEDKPVLLSVGYSSCHWCHVMEHESFEDEETARLMNERFVNVKVDREERPDVDSIYMTAVQQLTGHGGWPMTVFLTPEGEPFYGGTYYPPEPRHGLPSFRQVLEGIAGAYASQRDAVRHNAGELRDLLRQHAELRAAAPLDGAVLDEALRSIAARFDAAEGGFGRAPKFPQPMTLEFLLRCWARTGAPPALEMAVRTLEKMARGGIHDQLGGGFHRYSVDARWLVPHFEKMLYDNALLTRVYLHAWQALTGAIRPNATEAAAPDAEPWRSPETAELLRRTAEQTLDYVRREMTGPEGGFYSAQDADSEGVEGKFFVWTAAEVDAVLGPEEGPLFRAYYDVDEGGNWEGDHHHPPPQPISILNVPRTAEQVAEQAGIAVAQLTGVLALGRERLYQHRGRRVAPGLDDKVLTAWNAMMLQAFAEAARILDRGDYLEVALRNAEFLLRELRPAGRLLRTWKAGAAKIDAFLDDHALLVDALIALYEASWDTRWVDEARSLADALLERFWDEEQGIFYDAAADAEALIVRPRDLYDNATPSGSSAATLALLRLAALVGEPRYARVAARALEATGRLLAEMPLGFGRMLAALDHQLATPREVAVLGEREAEDTRALLRVLSEHYLPNTVLAFATPDEAPRAARSVPLLEARAPVDGRATAFVCERYACRMPVTTAADLARELAA